MKKYLLLLVGLTFIACSSDDDVDDTSDARNFLEKYDGFGYEYIDELDDVEYFFFSNSANFIKYVETWNDDTDCLEFREGQVTDGMNPSIITNDSSRLVVDFSYSEGGDNYTYRIEFIVSSDGNTLTLRYDDSDNPDDIDIFTKTTSTFASLCN